MHSMLLTLACLYTRNYVSLEGDIEGGHCTSLHALLPNYCILTTVSVRDGSSTAFWEDSWLPEGPLCDVLPALYSHVVTSGAMVRDVLQGGVDRFLRNRATRVPAAEKVKLLLMLNGMQLRDGTTPGAARCKEPTASSEIRMSVLRAISHSDGSHGPLSLPLRLLRLEESCSATSEVLHLALGPGTNTITMQGQFVREARGAERQVRPLWPPGRNDGPHHLPVSDSSRSLGTPGVCAGCCAPCRDDTKLWAARIPGARSFLPCRTPM
ncbi:hypothetical protein SEVIR_8G096100v4 [Setaria viridis]|uniref:Uncharacterized protein n=1 Tax=Setaria viridis TaxID=4556 RepID=A0A4U6TDP9_SETVI|nr:hypothetical protein SEVIR_8G096100v2 [Setaria viridis]